MGGEQRFDLLPQLAVFTTGSVQVCGPFTRVGEDCLIHELLHPLPLLPIHCSSASGQPASELTTL